MSLDCFTTKQICTEVVQIKPNFLAYISDDFKTQEMRNEAVCNKPHTLWYTPGRLKTQRCMIRWWIATHGTCNMFPIALRHKKCVIRQLVIVHGCLVPSVIILKLERCATSQWIDIYTYWGMSLIGLWHSKYGHGIMMNLLSGIMVIKNGRPGRQGLRRSFYPSPGIPIVRWIGACQKTKGGCGRSR